MTPPHLIADRSQSSFTRVLRPYPRSSAVPSPSLSPRRAQHIEQPLLLALELAPRIGVEVLQRILHQQRQPFFGNAHLAQPDRQPERAELAFEMISGAHPSIA